MTITIQDHSPRVHYICTSGQRIFNVPFEFLHNADLKVYVNEVLQFFNAAPAANASQYNLVGEGVTGGGTLTFGPPGRAVGDELIIYRDMPIDSPAEFPTAGVFPVASLNTAFDETTAMIQQTEVNVEKRTLRLANEDFTVELNKLPSIPGRMGRILGFDFNGQPILVKPIDLLSLGGTGPTDPGASYLGLIWIGDSPPPAPWVNGQQWWESDTGHLYVFYDDGTSAQWIQINIGTGTLGQGPVVTPQQAIIDVTPLTAASGNYTFPPNARYFRLRGCGGGGGAGSAASTLGTYSATGGGGSGGFGETDWMDATGPSGASYLIGQGGAGGISGNAGASGGPTTWNDGVRSLTWGGGAGSAGFVGSANEWMRPGGAAGVLPTGFVIRSGEAGSPGMSQPTSQVGGNGGGNPLGQGADGPYITSSFHAGIDAVSGFGGGGSGAVRSTLAAGYAKGGNGADGVIYVEVLF